MPEVENPTLTCAYCGKENNGSEPFCIGCGTSLERSDSRSLISIIKSLRVLDARFATFILFVNFAVSLICAVTTILVVITITKFHPIYQTTKIDHLSGNVLLAFLIENSVVATIAIIWLSVILLPKAQLKHSGASGAALSLGPFLALLKGLLLGGAIVFLAYGMSKLWVWPIYYGGKDPISQFYRTPGFSRIMNVMFGIILAPISEEIIFRGILYAGYRNSFGSVKATILVTALFISLHLPYACHTLLTMVTLITMSLAVLWFRLRYDAIGAAIAVHMGYNIAVTFLHFYRL